MGIDPAGPIFDQHSSKYRLDKNDATVVHVLHTSTPFSGLEDPIGHNDFYPNGLWDNQPETCPNSDQSVCGCPKEWTTTPNSIYPFFHNNQGEHGIIKDKPVYTSFSTKPFCRKKIIIIPKCIDCSHIWGIELLIRIWEHNDGDWYCDSNVYCTSMSGRFPRTIEDINTFKVL